MPVEVTYLSVIKNPVTGWWVSGWLLPDGTFDMINFQVDFILSTPLTGKTLSVEAYIDGKRIGDPYESASVTDGDAKFYSMDGNAQLRYPLKGSLVSGHIFTLRYILNGEVKEMSARFYTKEEILPRNVIRTLAVLGIVFGVGGTVYAIKKPGK